MGRIDRGAIQMVLVDRDVEGAFGGFNLWVASSPTSMGRRIASDRSKIVHLPSLDLQQGEVLSGHEDPPRDKIKRDMTTQLFGE